MKNEIIQSRTEQNRTEQNRTTRQNNLSQEIDTVKKKNQNRTN